MRDLFKAELLRFRVWAAVSAIAHAVVLGFLSRLVDLAQQPLAVYQVFGMVYGAAALLLGLYQMGTYRRPNQWLNLLHRPLPPRRIALALCGAGALLLLIAIAMPIALAAIYQKALTARVVDLRHWLMPLAALLLSLCAYLAGCYLALAGKRHSWSALVLPVLLAGFSAASGVAALVLQSSMLLWLALLVGSAFKPDLGTPPRGALVTVAAALPLQVGVYLLLWLLSIGCELVWTLLGTHPLNAPTPPRGGFIEAERADGKALLLAGLADSRDAQAPLWREQVGLSDVFQLNRFNRLPERNELGNPGPMEFDDAERRVRWVFSHDRMRFEGQGLLDPRTPMGELGLGDEAFALPSVLLPVGDEVLLGRDAVYQYDGEQHQLRLRAQLPAGEVLASRPRPIGDNVALLSDRALYVYAGREVRDGFELLAPRLRVPLPERVYHLSRLDLIELMDGYLLSFTYSVGVPYGQIAPFQQLLQVDGEGRVHDVARRELSPDLPAIYRYRDWWLSPPLRALCLAATQFLAAPQPLREPVAMSRPGSVVWLAAALNLLSLAGAAWLVRRRGLSPRARWVWIAVCGGVGLPALLSLWLLYPPREDEEAPTFVQPALA